LEAQAQYLSDKAPRDIREYLEGDDRVLLPFGSIENNGPHLPLASDLLAAVAIAERAARATGVLIAPPIPWGISSCNIAFPGTMSLSAETSERIIMELCMSLASHGFRRVAVISGHSSNVWSAANAAESLRDRGILVTQLDVWRCVEQWCKDLPSTDSFPFGHGSEMMTSVLLAAAPGLVREDRMAPEMPKESFGLKYYDSYPGIMGFAAWDDVSVSGSIGDPTGASAAIGSEALQRLADRLVELLEDMRSAPLPQARTLR
jgi:creatinine amidohydrolase/Fe(II)-dependent formamide hydrolase-like protein